MHVVFHSYTRTLKSHCLLPGTVDFWKQVGSFLYKLVKLKPREVKVAHSAIKVLETDREQSISEPNEQLIVPTPQESAEISTSGNSEVINNSSSESQDQSVCYGLTST